MRPVSLCLALSALTLAACGGDGSDATSESGVEQVAADHVDIERSRFSDDELAVAAGTTVEFLNKDPFAHTVTAVDGSPMAFDSGELAAGASFEVTFEEPGKFDYVCLIHPTMRATVVVT